MAVERERVMTESKLHLMLSRVLKVARFDGETFRELKEDQKATGQAVAIVAFGGISYGLGLALIDVAGTSTFSATGLLIGTLVGLILALFAAIVWSMATFVIGTRLFKGTTTFFGLVRPLFYSTCPAVLFVLIGVPIFPVRQAVGAIVAGWTVVGGVFAIKNAMGFSKERSMLTVVVAVLILVLVASFFGR